MTGPTGPAEAFPPLSQGIGPTGQAGPFREQAWIDCPVCGRGAGLQRPTTAEELAEVLAARRAALVNHYVLDHHLPGDRAYDDWPKQRDWIIAWAAL